MSIGGYTLVFEEGGERCALYTESGDVYVRMRQEEMIELLCRRCEVSMATAPTTYGHMKLADIPGLEMVPDE